ncbi:DUF2415 domain-containing protein [Mycena indigotica]|uniref:DUF2415 domain-containing protein n=1 Tax=Mycena indigotica TaxID=2126181 RepID=A0A8H6T9J9_9AGAR|nr:DUF2415 domain-containing protein [Mycena indigotica]KAF7312701.1 DUF2415 domain-containing protein [Mycena indigotica]
MLCRDPVRDEPVTKRQSPSSSLTTMAKDPPLLSSPAPSSTIQTDVTISHVQLRDLIVCPREQGVVNYVQDKSIKEVNVRKPSEPPRTLVELAFVPNTLSSLSIPDTNQTLLAAGGQDAEVHLSLLRDSNNRVDWQFSTHLDGSINNSILLTSLSLTDSPESSIEPRMAVSNNDRCVMFFDVPIRARPAGIAQVGSVHMNVPINHSSISPDGRTLLSVGDSSKIYLHRLTGGGYVTATSIATLTLPPTPPNPNASPALVASFSTAFSADGSKYAVASQEGFVAIWDVRSTRPLKVFHTDKSRGGNASMAWDPQDWSNWKSRGPGWSTRAVKFGGRPERELMMFTEHTSLVHVVDARTFEREEIIEMPRFEPITRPMSPASAVAARFASTLEETFRVAIASETDGDEDVLVIPPLGDHAVEQEVRRVLQQHGMRSRSRSGSELEADLAGACFDPSGANIYVASDMGIAEWQVRGADKRWWSGGAWQR